MITQTPGHYDKYACRSPRHRAVFDRAVDSRSTPRRTAAIAEAKQICGQCPASTHCLQDAMLEEGPVGAQYRFGIRGGLGPAERASRAAKRPKRKYIDAAPTLATVADLQRRGFHLPWISREIGHSNLQMPGKRIRQDIADQIGRLADQIGPDLVMPSIARGRPRPRLKDLLDSTPEAA